MHTRSNAIRLFAAALVVMSVLYMPVDEANAQTTRAGITLGELTYTPEYPQKTDVIVFAITVNSTSPLSYVKITYCNELSCMPPQAMTDKGNGVYEFTVPNSFVSTAKKVKAFVEAGNGANETARTPVVYEGVYTIEFDIGAAAPSDGETVYDWNNTADADDDLLPDWWETKNGLDPNDKTDGTAAQKQKYQTEYNAAKASWEEDDDGKKDSPGFDAVLMAAALAAAVLAAFAYAGRRR